MASLVKGKYDYNSGHEDDLSFSAGQIITVIGEEDDEWFSGEYTGSDGKHYHGMFPRNFVTIVPAQDAVESVQAARRVVKEPPAVSPQQDPISIQSPPPAKAAVTAPGRGPTS